MTISNINITTKTYRHQIFHDIHVWQRVDFNGFVVVCVDFVKASQSVASVYVHGT